MEPINVLWTGGWDSTYRVLELLFIEKKAVRPHYIVNPNRNSLVNEIRAMNRIRRRVLSDHPGLATDFLPPVLTHYEAIPADGKITGWFNDLAAKTPTATQYQVPCAVCTILCRRTGTIGGKVHSRSLYPVWGPDPPTIKGRGSRMPDIRPFSRTGAGIVLLFQASHNNPVETGHEDHRRRARVHRAC